MPVFSLGSGDKKLSRIKEVAINKERQIQSVIEANIAEVFGLEFVDTEFSLNKFRIDTLAYDVENKSFVIIEYKKDKNFSVVDQGYAYLSLLLNNKADFVLRYNSNSKKLFSKSDIDWSQSRVLFVAPEFTPYQVESVNFRDLPIELWQVRLYSNNTLSLEKIRAKENSESIKTISKGKGMGGDGQVEKEIKVYSEDEHLTKCKPDIKELYFEMKEKILNFGSNIEVTPKKCYIAFVDNRNFVDITPDPKAIWMTINLKKGQLNDPQRLALDYSKKGHWGNGDYCIKITNGKNVDYIIGLIKQAYEKHSK